MPLGSKAQVRAYKISKRFDCDISAVCAGLAIELDDAGVVVAARFAFGGMAATVKRATNAEGALVGKAWDADAVVAARAALATDFAPLTDMRASAAYRMQVAQNLLKRLWLETRARDPLHAVDTSVFAREVVHREHAGHPHPGPSASGRGSKTNSLTGARERAGVRVRQLESASPARTNPPTCTSPAARPTSTTSLSSPARCTRRSASRRPRTAS